MRHLARIHTHLLQHGAERRAQDHVHVHNYKVGDLVVVVQYPDVQIDVQFVCNMQSRPTNYAKLLDLSETVQLKLILIFQSFRHRHDSVLVHAKAIHPGSAP